MKYNMEELIRQNSSFMFFTSLLIIMNVTIFCWIGVILFRKWHDRGQTMPGFAPSWWHPFGIELKLLFLLTSGKVTLNEALQRILYAATYMFGSSGCFRGFLAFIPTVMVWKARGFEQILGTGKIVPKRFPYAFMKPVLGDGLVTSNGNLWQMRRKMLTPTFHFRILEDFVSVFNEQAQTFTKILTEYENLKPIDIVPLVEVATLDIICESAMGVNVHAQEDSHSDFATAVNHLSADLISRVPKFWLWPNIFYRLSAEGQSHRKNRAIFSKFVEQVIEERKVRIISKRNMMSDSKEDEVDEIGVKRRRLFLDLLLETHLENPEEMPLQGVHDEVATFIGAGYDTTAVGTSWALYFISCYPEVQAKVHQELDEIFGKDLERPITSDDIRRMKYLECCIKESQRIAPSVGLIARSLSEDTQIEGHKVRANTFVLMNIYALHRDPEVFPDPEMFIPERFLPENSVDRHPYAYVPFSAGLRNCIGQKFAIMEMKIVIAWTLRRFKLRAAVHRDKLHVQAEMVTRSRDGLHIYVESRTDSR